MRSLKTALLKRDIAIKEGFSKTTLAIQQLHQLTMTILLLAFLHVSQSCFIGPKLCFVIILNSCLTMFYDNDLFVCLNNAFTQSVFDD